MTKPPTIRFLTNLPKDKKPLVLAAAAESGQPVTWRDEPNDQIPPGKMRAEFGSIYGPGNSTEFWRVYYALEAKQSEG